MTQLFARNPGASFQISWTDLRLVADDTTESSFGALEFPWLSKDGDTLLMSFKDGKDSPLGGNYVTKLKKSTDQGATWGTATTVWAGTDDSGAFITALSTGTYILASQIYASDVAAGVYVKTSTDQGATWSANILVTDTAFATGHTYTSTAVFELANGDLLLPVYGKDATDTLAKIMKSTDGGATWSVLATMCAVSGVNVNEVVMQQMADGTLVALLRANDFKVRKVTSTDNGATWSSPTVLWSDCDSRIDWCKLSSGKSLAFYRQEPDSYGLMRYSDDDWNTYSSTGQVIGPDKRTTYGSLIETVPNVALLVMGDLDDSEVNGRIWSRHVLDGYGLAPTGQVTYTDNERLAEGRGNIVAYDRFTRPDNAQGLGSAQSGHQWLEYGGYASNCWNISGNTAKNNSGTSRHTTVDAGIVNGFIEADFLWSGSTSASTGLVARRSTSTGKALFCGLNSSGSSLEIDYYNGSSSIRIASAVTGLAFPANVWYRMRLSFKGRNIYVFIDGARLLSYQCPTGSGIPASAGGDLGADALDGELWGIRGGGGGITTQFKNLIISK